MRVSVVTTSPDLANVILTEIMTQIYRKESKLKSLNSPNYIKLRFE